MSDVELGREILRQILGATQIIAHLHLDEPTSLKSASASPVPSTTT